MDRTEETIAAQASAPGVGGIGIVRVSGPQVGEMSRALFGKLPDPRVATTRILKDANGCPIDQAVAVFFQGPHSYTGQDTLELHCHGSPIVLDQVLERLLTAGGDIIRQGGTEADLLADCTRYVSRILTDMHGEAFQGTKMGITASVHSGPRGALPHGSVTTRRPLPGEPVIAGIGCSIGGYHAESGATFIVGEPSGEQRRIMDAMELSTSATVAALVGRRSCSEVNDAALAPIHAAGLGDAIRHRIGHGMGVEGHEAPWLAPGDDTRTAPGMVFSCEPGIYRPGLDGWRTIDTLIVGHNQVEVASGFLKRHPPESRVLDC